jgi:hypothetical protein
MTAAGTRVAGNSDCCTGMWTALWGLHGIAHEKPRKTAGMIVDSTSGN